MPRPKEKLTQPESPRKGLRAETAYARQLFLYGNGDGKRVLNVNKLSQLSGVTAETLRVHLVTWEKEVEETLKGTSEHGLAFALRAEDVTLHHKDMEHLRNDLESIKWEQDNLSAIVAKLEGICEEFSLNTDNGDRALRVFETYLQASMNKARLRSQFLAAQKQWATLSGICDLKDIQATAAKELEKGRVKIKLKSEMGETMKDVTPATSAAMTLRD